MFRWIEGTSITFTLGEDFVDLPGGNYNLTSVYLACLIKAALDDKEEAEDSELINKKARVYFLDYCENPENKVKKNKHIKKALKTRG